MDATIGPIIRGIETRSAPDRAWAWIDDARDRPTLVRWQVVPLAQGGARISLVHEGWAEAGAGG